MRFKVLCSISIRHGYLAKPGTAEDAPTPGVEQYLQLIPTPETRTFMHNHRLFLKPGPGKWSVIGPLKASSNTPLIEWLPSTRLNFFLQVRQPEFWQATDFSIPEDGYDLARTLSGEVFPHFTNVDQSDTALLKLTQDDSYRHQDNFQRLTSDTYRAFLSRRPLSTELNHFVPINLPQRASITVDGYSSEANTLDLTLSGLEEGDTFGLTYRAIPPWASDTFGLVEIAPREAYSTSDQVKDYLIRFQASQATWHYLVIAEADKSFNKDVNNPQGLNILLPGYPSTDPTEAYLVKAKVAPIDPPADPSTKGKVEERIFSLAKALRESHPGSEVYQLTKPSNQAPERESSFPLMGITLRDGNENQIENLLIPSLSKAGIEVINVYSPTLTT